MTSRSQVATAERLRLTKARRYPGEQAPAALLDGLQFEMLYGLNCLVSESGLRMSEIFSRLGGFAGPLVTNATGQLDLLGPKAVPQRRRPT